MLLNSSSIRESTPGNIICFPLNTSQNDVRDLPDFNKRPRIAFLCNSDLVPQIVLWPVNLLLGFLVWK